MDNVTNPGVSVVGFDFSGDEMLRGELLTFEPGLTVLYGLNGTGKSRLLRGVYGALLGIQTDVNVSLVAHARVTDTIEQFDLLSSQSQRPASRPFSLALAQELADSSDYIASPGQRSSERRLHHETVRRVIANHIEEMVGEGYPELMSEVLEDQLFLLAPTGTDGAPSWSAYAVADAARPGASAAIERAAEVNDTFPDEGDDQDAYAAAYDAWVDRMCAVPVLEEAAQLFTARGPRVALIRPFSVVLFNATLTDLDHEGPISIVGPVDFGLDVLDLERDAVDATGDYLARLVAGAIGDYWGNIAPDPFDGTFPLGTPDRAEELWQRTSEENRSRVEARVEQTIREAAIQLSELVTNALADILIEPLIAHAEVAPAVLRLASPSFEWRFHRPTRDEVRVGIESLSRAEQLWATRSINEALYWHRREHDEDLQDSLRPAVYLLDEPESALHRAAEAFMARSLVRRASDPRRALLVATHSPELLDTSEARLVGLRHPPTHFDLTVRLLDFSDRDLLSELGFTPSDLLRWPRVILLVEGLHDQVLLDHYLGGRLRAARVEILVLRGGTKLPLAVDSRVLYKHTEAHIVGLVDNENAKVLRETWANAQDAAAQGSTQAAIDIVLQGIPRTRSESDFVRDWLTSALERGLDGRITPYALEAADIIEYLPVEMIVPGAVSWEELKLQHHAVRQTKPKSTAKDFKQWLRIEHGVEFTEESLRVAATGTSTPREFEMLMKTLEAISAHRS